MSRNFKILGVLTLVAIAVMSIGYHWFDSEPVEPEIIGVGYLRQHDNGMYTVQVETGMYFVSEVYVSASEDDTPVLSKPIDGAIVTVVKFTNEWCDEGQGVKFMVGRWDEAQIEKAFHTNSLLIMIAMLVLIYCVLYMVFHKTPTEEVKVAQA
ncbi:MAG: hypothetical protein J6X42_03530 [Alphaproteobacteria bacterium]|nr:hypothetical protein [Alphaproteobacteria bacterium]